jgi:protein-S-isoprenylcysteine O-methyltransferase Ste14
MKSAFLTVARVIGFFITLYIWRRVQIGEFLEFTGFTIVIIPILLVFPTSWISRKLVDVKPTVERVAWITSTVHMVLMIFFGSAIVESIIFFQIWQGPRLPIPVEVSTVLLYLTGFFLLLTVVNLALSGLGAPFAIALSRRIANRWMYRWTRNPMVLSTLATLLSAGLYLQSLYFILWVVLLVTPAWIYFLKAYEERELEIRFGASYLDYKANTSFLWPRKPRD